MFMDRLPALRRPESELNTTALVLSPDGPGPPFFSNRGVSGNTGVEKRFCLDSNCAVLWSSATSFDVPQGPHMQAVLPLNEMEGTGHWEHAALPLAGLYVSAGHAVHVTPNPHVFPEPVAVYPALQKQSSALPINEWEFAGQSVHAVRPIQPLYFPAIHF